MPTTPTMLLPYPAPTEPADVPTDMAELATRLETVRGLANGLASLGADGKVPAAQLPPAAPTYPSLDYLSSVNTSELTLTTSAVLLPGTAITLTAAGKWLCLVSNIFWCDTMGTTSLRVQIFHAGVAAATGIATPYATGGTSAYIMAVRTATAGQVLDLRAFKDAAAGAARVLASSASLIAIRISP